MNRALARCIVESLRVTGPFEESLGRLRAFSRRDWQHTLAWLDDSGLALYFWDRLNRFGASDALPAEIGAQLERDLASNQRRLAEMQKEFDSLNRRFEAAGVEYVVLKGFALIPDYCPDAALRTQYDYDYLVHPKSANVAQRTLELAGYSQKNKNPGFQLPFFAAQPLSLPSPNDNFYSADIPRTVELHSSLWESADRDMINLQLPGDALDRKRPMNWEGLCFPVLEDDDTLVFQTLHAFQHILIYWCRPSCFLEIARFIARRHSDASFWERFRSRFEGRKYLPEIAGLIFSLATSLFEAPVPKQVAAWTTRNLPAALSLWVQRHGRNWVLACFPGSKLSLFVHREFVEDPDAWNQVILTRLFPVHRPARAVESGNPTLMSRALATWDQWRFVWSRLAFHLGALLDYLWELPRWKLLLYHAQQDHI
jgi:hypothetical protein